MLDAESARQVRNQMTAAAFMAWLQGAGGEKTFQQYLRGLGLVEKQKPISEEAKKKLVARSKNIAAKIMAMDKKRKPRK